MKNLFIAFFLSAAFFLLASADLYKPYYAYIGDEYAFFDKAISIVDGDRPNIFSQQGVYGYHPVLDSYYQTIFIYLFGPNVYGWKISAIFLVSITIIIFYFFLKDNFNSRVALFGAFLIATSHYILALVHTGYNNIHSLLPVVLSLFLISRKNILLSFLAGIVSGLGFYTFYSARLTIFFLGMFIFDKKTPIKIYLFTFLGFLTSVIPFVYFNRSEVFTQMIDQTFIRNQNPLTPGYILTNLGINLKGIYFGSSHNHHYVSGSLVDGLSNLLSLLGFFALIVTRKFKTCLFLAGSYILILLTAGGLFHEHTVAITRLFIILPFIFISAAIGFDFLVSKIHNIYFRSIISAMIIIVVSFLNLYQFYIKTPSVNTKTQEVMILENLFQNDNPSISEKEIEDNYVLNQIFKVYKLK